MAENLAELVAFLRARLAEDDEWARQCSGSHWMPTVHGSPGAESQGGRVGQQTAMVLSLGTPHDAQHPVGSIPVVCSAPHSAEADAAMHHIACHDPSRVQAASTAMRELLDLYEYATDECEADLLGKLVLRFAQQYHQHPRFQAKWIMLPELPDP